MLFRGKKQFIVSMQSMQIGKQPALQLVIAGSSPVTVEHYK